MRRGTLLASTACAVTVGALAIASAKGTPNSSNETSQQRAVRVAVDAPNDVQVCPGAPFAQAEARRPLKAVTPQPATPATPGNDADNNAGDTPAAGTPAQPVTRLPIPLIDFASQVAVASDIPPTVTASALAEKTSEAFSTDGTTNTSDADTTETTKEKDPLAGVLGFVDAYGWKTTARGASTLVDHPLTSPVSLSGASTEGLVPVIGSMTTWSATGGIGRGLATTACPAAVESAWLVGGNTTAGRETFLVVANPQAASVTASVHVYAGSGQSEAAGTKDVVLPAASYTTIPLSAVAAGESSMAVHVSSTDGRVSSYLTEQAIGEDNSDGVEFVTTSLAPTTRQLVPGVRVGVGSSTTVRVVNPGDVEAIVSLVMLDGNKNPVPMSTPLSVPPRSVATSKVATNGAARDVSFVVSSDQPVAAALSTTIETGRFTTPGTSPDNPFDVTGGEVIMSDTAWYASGQPLASSRERASVIPVDARGRAPRVTFAIDGEPEASTADANGTTDSSSDSSAGEIAYVAVMQDGTFGDVSSIKLKAGTSKTVSTAALSRGIVSSLLVWAPRGDVAASISMTSTYGITSTTPSMPPTKPEDVSIVVSSG